MEYYWVYLSNWHLILHPANVVVVIPTCIDPDNPVHLGLNPLSDPYKIIFVKTNVVFSIPEIQTKVTRCICWFSCPKCILFTNTSSKISHLCSAV